MFVQVKNFNDGLSALSYLGNNMDRLLNNMFDPGGSSVQLSSTLLRSKFYETDENLIIVVEVPGIPKNDIKITYQDNILSISGERKPLEISEDTKMFEKERVFGKFLRTFRVPFNIDTEKITAENKDGILTIKLVKSEKAKPKEIQIN